MLCTLHAGDFTAEIEPVLFPEDAPVNTALRLRVRSGAFAGEGTMDVNRTALSQFAADLDLLYRTLTGAAVLEEPYGFHQYIRFDAQKGGYIAVQGCLTRPVPGLPEQELRFAGRFDQTHLHPFVSRLQNIISHIALNF